MRTAFISDIHGHWQGLEIVLHDIQSLHIDRIVCLGDMIDGGTQNNQVVDFMRTRQILSVQGNHDVIDDCGLTAENQNWLRALPQLLLEEDVVFAHVSPHKRQLSINNNIEAWNVFDESDFRLCFIGHIHFPVLFGEISEDFGEARVYAVDNERYLLDSKDRYIISFGAVGYPRRGGKYIRYGIYDSLANTIEFRRLEGELLPYGLCLPI